ncbi:Primase [Propionibacterium freudenreichii]|uniref:hypothetical protein n=1 Tax=Propionibacterium freudenreichii TaxID=1744 RepID=UPI000543C8C3|nr:hypothetical protein [Propionibacterium freudenreichii]CEH05784.1 Primase [Propionibacterium freudenreichii]
MTEPTMYAVARAPRKESKVWVNGSMTWDEIIEVVRHPVGHKECGCWLFGTLMRDPLTGEVYRRKTTILSRSAVLLDADAAWPDLPDKVLALGVRCLVHSTWRSRPKAPRYRIIIPLSRPVMPDEYTIIAGKLIRQLGTEQFDQTCADPIQFSFLPSNNRRWNDYETYEEADAC